MRTAEKRSETWRTNIQTWCVYVWHIRHTCICALFDYSRHAITCIYSSTLWSKTFLQRYWTDKIDWDKSPQMAYQTAWLQLYEEFISVRNMTFRRYVGLPYACLELYAFCDASLSVSSASVLAQCATTPIEYPTKDFNGPQAFTRLHYSQYNQPLQPSNCKTIRQLLFPHTVCSRQWSVSYVATCWRPLRQTQTIRGNLWTHFTHEWYAVRNTVHESHLTDVMFRPMAVSHMVQTLYPLHHLLSPTRRFKMSSIRQIIPNPST